MVTSASREIGAKLNCCEGCGKCAEVCPTGALVKGF